MYTRVYIFPGVNWSLDLRRVPQADWRRGQGFETLSQRRRTDITTAKKTRPSPPKKARNRANYHHGELRESMRQGALLLIGRLGIEGFSFRELAREVGVSHAAPYRHFAGKEELLASLALEGYHKLYACMHEASQQTRDPLEQIRLAGKAYIHFALDHKEVYAVMFDHYFDPVMWPELHKTIFLAAGVIEAAVGQCRRQGMMKGHEIKDHVNYAWAVTHGIAKLLNTGRLPVADSRTKNQFIDFALENALGTWPK